MAPRRREEQKAERKWDEDGTDGDGAGIYRPEGSVLLQLHVQRPADTKRMCWQTDDKHFLYCEHLSYFRSYFFLSPTLSIAPDAPYDADAGHSCAISSKKQIRYE